MFLSVAAYSGMPFLAAYSPSKAALGIMIKNVANAVSGHQIRVNGINLDGLILLLNMIFKKNFIMPKKIG